MKKMVCGPSNCLNLLTLFFQYTIRVRMLYPFFLTAFLSIICSGVSDIISKRLSYVVLLPRKKASSSSYWLSIPFTDGLNLVQLAKRPNVHFVFV